MTYGIGRVPADVDFSDEFLAELEAERLQPTPRRTEKPITCRRCRQTGYAGEYPFSTLGGENLCDDCV